MPIQIMFSNQGLICAFCLVLVTTLPGAFAVLPSFYTVTGFASSWIDVGTGSIETALDASLSYANTAAPFGGSVFSPVPTWGDTPDAFLVVDYELEAIRSINPTSGDTTTLASRSDADWAVGLTARFMSPRHIVLGDACKNESFFTTWDYASIQKLNTDTGAFELLTELEMDTYPQGIVRWFDTALSKWLLLVSFGEEKEILAYQETTGSTENGWKVTTPGFAGAMSLSPDGTRLVVTNDDAGGGMYFVDLATKTIDMTRSGGMFVDVPRVNKKLQGVTWSSDGKWVLGVGTGQNEDTVFVKASGQDLILTMPASKMPHNNVLDVTYLSADGKFLVTYPGGVSIVKFANPELVCTSGCQVAAANCTAPPPPPVCRLGDLDTDTLFDSFPLAANQPDLSAGDPDTTHANGTVFAELDQCVSGYTASGRFTVECDAQGSWTTTDTGFTCTDTALAALLAELLASQTAFTPVTIGSANSRGSGLGSAADTEFKQASPVAARGDVGLVSDGGNNRIVSVSLLDGESSLLLDVGNPNSIAWCNDNEAYFGSVDNEAYLKKFDPTAATPTAATWMTVGFTQGLACLTDASRNWLFVADSSFGLRAYNRDVQPANKDDSVWGGLSNADLGVSALGGIGLSPDLEHLAFVASDNHNVGTVNIATKKVTWYGSGTQGPLDGPAGTAQFHFPTDVDWSKDGRKLIVNEYGNTAGFRFIDFKTGHVFTGKDNLMPTVNGHAVTVLDDTGKSVVTFQSGLKVMQIDFYFRCDASDFADRLADYPLAANKPTFTDDKVANATSVVLNQCVSGYTASGSVSLDCLNGEFQFADNAFFCQDTEMQAHLEAQNIEIDELRTNATQDLQTIAALETTAANNLAAVQLDVVSTQSDVGVLQTNTSTRFDDVTQNTDDVAQLRNDLTITQSDVDVLETNATTSADAIAALQQDVNDNVKVSLADNAQELLRQNASLLEAHDDIAELQTTTIDAVKADVATNAGQIITNKNSIVALQPSITQVQSNLGDLATDTAIKFAAVQTDLTAIQDDVTVVQGTSSAQAGSIAAIQNEITDDVKVSIAQNDARLDAHNASITQAQQDITALQQADLQASTRTDQIAANVTQAKTDITQVEQQVSVVDTKADKAKTSGDQNARTVEDVQDEASTANGSTLAIGVIALLIGLAACAGAIFFVVRKKKSKADTQSNQQAMDLTPA